jgi:hypothetical protein
MREPKTHFAQIPVAEVKKIAEEVHDDVAGKGSVVTRTSPGKLKPHRTALLENKGKRAWQCNS